MSPESDNYQSGPGISYFHADHNMNPYRAAGLLRKVAKQHAKGLHQGKRGKMSKAAPKHAMMPSKVSSGARVFGGKK